MLGNIEMIGDFSEVASLSYQHLPQFGRLIKGFSKIFCLSSNAEMYSLWFLVKVKFSPENLP
jgi:hypothetical protein